MSRYPIFPNQSLLRDIPHACVVVGWDNPLGTFFGQVLDPDRPLDQDETVYWVGTRPFQIPTLDDLAGLMEVYAIIPEEIRAYLTRDQATSPPRTPLQEHMLKILAHV